LRTFHYEGPEIIINLKLTLGAREKQEIFLSFCSIASPSKIEKPFEKSFFGIMQLTKKKGAFISLIPLVINLPYKIVRLESDLSPVLYCHLFCTLL
jgi:hypothetical protein